MSRKMSEQQQQEAPAPEMEREMEYHFKLEVEALDPSSDLSPKSPAGTQTDKTTEMEISQDVQRTGTDKWPMCSTKTLVLWDWMEKEVMNDKTKVEIP